MGQAVPASECGVTALSMEFVSKPEEAHRLRTAIPAAIEGLLGQVPGFSGCMLLIADKEPRLVTVITLWEGENRAGLSSNGVAWIHKIAAPFLDHCLKCERMTHSPRSRLWPRTCVWIALWKIDIASA